MKVRKIILIIVDNFLAIGLFIFAVGVLSYYNSSRQNAVSSLPVKTSLTERDIAITEAVKNGKKEYTFTTRFIPGVGVITDPEAYKKEWEQQLQEDSNKKAP